jgi:hypothetical protein
MPTVVTKNGGPAEIVTDPSNSEEPFGEIVDPSNIQAVSVAMDRVKRRPKMEETQRRERAITSIRRRYRYETAAMLWLTAVQPLKNVVRALAPTRWSKRSEATSATKGGRADAQAAPTFASPDVGVGSAADSNGNGAAHVGSVRAAGAREAAVKEPAAAREAPWIRFRAFTHQRLQRLVNDAQRRSASKAAGGRGRGKS